MAIILQWLVPKYLETQHAVIDQKPSQIRDYFQTTFGGIFPFGSTLEQMSKQNLAMFERTMRMFTPFGVPGSEGDTTAVTDPSCGCEANGNGTRCDAFVDRANKASRAEAQEEAEEAASRLHRT